MTCSDQATQNSFLAVLLSGTRSQPMAGGADSGMAGFPEWTSP